MRAIDAMEAAQMWIKLRKRKNLIDCIHHTDGGGQYFSDLYLGMLKDLEAKVSRAITCLENGYAEQRNGLIKQHLLPLIDAVGTEVPRQQMKEVIKTYNHERKQKGLKWLSPVDYETYTSKIKPKPEIQLFDFK
jgi:transposase InsO family protein